MSSSMINYLGSKSGSGVFQAIINLMPPHDTYIELFLGTGIVMSKKPKSNRQIGIDLNIDCINSFNCLENDIELHNMDSFNFLKECDFTTTGRTVIYCDPPYLLETRTSNKRYKFEFSDSDHLKLLRYLKKLPDNCYILLSGYRNSLYEKLINDWWSVDFQTMSRGGVRTETVWTNFTPDSVHYHTYAGKDFTDRQRIKRKAARWASSFRELPSAERQAILASLLMAHNYND